MSRPLIVRRYMKTKLFKFFLPTACFGLAVVSWICLVYVAVLDAAAKVVRPIRLIFLQPEEATHLLLGYMLLGIAVVSFCCGVFCTWRLFRYARRA